LNRLGRRPPEPLGAPPQLVVMARWPAPGRCKLRLAADLGSRRAAAIQASLSRHGLSTALRAQQHGLAHGLQFELVLAVSGLGPRAARRWGAHWPPARVVAQGEGRLGTRLQRQVRRAQREGSGAVVLIGSDLPHLAASDLLAAFEALQGRPLVLGPAVDGGYWLIGLRGSQPWLFCGSDGPIGWGGDQVLERTRRAASRCGLDPLLLRCQADLDWPSDLAHWR